MASWDRSDLLLAFLLGRTVAERVGLSESQANQWGAIQMAFGLSGVGLLVVHELARRDVLAYAADSAARQQEAQQLQASLIAMQAATERAADSARGAEAASWRAAAEAGQAVAMSERAAIAAERAAESAARAADVSARAAASAEAAAARSTDAAAAAQQAADGSQAALDVTRETATAAGQAAQSAERAAQSSERILQILSERRERRPRSPARQPPDESGGGPA